jgi:hypothetical protein
LPGSSADSYAPSLARSREVNRINVRAVTPPARRYNALHTLRYQETINGRPYVIEVLPVGPDRWRAQIARHRGGTTALMPFYGTTPDDAARRLSDWLTRASGRPIPNGH